MKTRISIMSKLILLLSVVSLLQYCGQNNVLFAQSVEVVYPGGNYTVTAKRNQIIYTAQELLAKGAPAGGGTISQLGFSYVNSNGVLTNYSIRLRNIKTGNFVVTNPATGAGGSYNPNITYSVSGNVLTVTNISPSNFQIGPGMYLFALGQVGVPCCPHNYITANGTGNGGLGTYILAYSQSASGSENIFRGNAGALIAGYHHSSLTTVKNPFNFTPVVGSSNNDFNMITLDTPFLWDGVSDLLVDVCFESGTASHRYAIGGIGESIGASQGCIADPTVNTVGNNARPIIKLQFGTPCENPVINVQPIQHPPICESSNTTITISVTATGQGVLNYQWRHNDIYVINEGGVSGQGTSTLTITNPGTQHAGNYQVLVTNQCGTVTSNTVQLVIDLPPSVPETISGITSIVIGESTTLTSVGGTVGSGAVYEWFEGACGVGNVIGTNASIQVTPATTTTYFVRRVGNSSCTNVTDCISVTVVVGVSLSCADNISPANQSTNVAVTDLLQWDSVTDASSYDVYFGATSPPPFFENTSNTFSNPILDYQTTYFWKVVPKNQNNEAIGCSENTFTTETGILTWTGAISTDWNTAGNWNFNIVPTAADDILIPSNYTHPPIIEELKIMPAQCKDITINQNAVLTINPNKAFTINGNILNSGTLHIKSNANGDGSLLLSGVRTGNGIEKIDRFFTGNFWHLVSATVTNATAQVFLNVWLRSYSEPNNNWGNIIVNPSTPLQPGIGYGVWSYEEYETRTFQGIMNNGQIVVPNITLTGSPGPQNGWNLVGNPYPSAISWNISAGWSKQSISNTIYLYSSVHGNYLTWNGFIGAAGPFIASGQGFFVQAISNTASLSINNNARIHSEVPFRAVRETEDIISIQVEGNNYSDNCYLMYRSDASDNYDFQYDAVKMPGVPAAPQIYTKKMDNGTEVNLAVYSTNDIQNLDGKFVFLEVGATNQYTLRFEHTMISNFEPLIRDRVTNAIIQPEEDYNFTSTPTDNEDRFEIINANTVETHRLLDSKITVWTHNNTLYIDNFQDNQIKQIRIYNTLGSVIMELDRRITNLENLPSGIYIVALYTDLETIIKKISVH